MKNELRIKNDDAIKFSIIVPIYNSANYLCKCLDSIIYQTYRNFELILVNDGSNDNSANICEMYARNDSRLKIVNQKNLGVSMARNAGIKIAQGEFILFVDSDDWINCDSLEVLSKILEQKNYDLIIFNLHLSKSKEIISNDYSELSVLIKNETINSPCNKVYKKSIIKNKKIAFEKQIEMGEDLLFNLSYLRKINCLIYLCNKKLYHVQNINSDSLTKKYIKNKYKQLMRVNKEINDWGIEVKSQELISSYKYIKFKNISSSIMDVFHKNCQFCFNEKIYYIRNIKKENKRIIVKSMGIKIYLLSIIYSFLPSIVLFYVYKIILRNKKNKKRKSE